MALLGSGNCSQRMVAKQFKQWKNVRMVSSKEISLRFRGTQLEPDLRCSEFFKSQREFSLQRLKKSLDHWIKKTSLLKKKNKKNSGDRSRKEKESL